MRRNKCLMNLMIIFPYIYMNQANIIAKTTRVANDLMMFPSVVGWVTVAIPVPESVVVVVKQEVHLELVSSHVKVFIVYNWHVLANKVFPATSVHPDTSGPQTV